MALHVFAATSGNFWEAPRAAIAVKKNVPLEWMELSQLSLYMALFELWSERINCPCDVIQVSHAVSFRFWHINIISNIFIELFISFYRGKLFCNDYRYRIIAQPYQQQSRTMTNYLQIPEHHWQTSNLVKCVVSRVGYCFFFFDTGAKSILLKQFRCLNRYL